jgi:hypothetical protein
MTLNSIVWLIKKSINQRKIVLTFIKNYLNHKVYVILNKEKYSLETNIFYIDVPDAKMVRYLYNMSMALVEAGHHVKIKANLFLIGNLYDYANWVLTTPNIFITKKNPKSGEIILTTEENKYPLSIHVDLNYYSRNINIQNECIVPLSMHPSFYRFGYLDQLPQLQLIKKSILVFFAGSFSEKHYNSQLLHLFQNMPTRMELLSVLQSNEILNVHFPENSEEAFAAINNSDNKILIINRSKAPIYPDEWLKILAKAFFFIAFPGTTIPFCHNLVEALAVGCIPILSYAHQMPAGLQDGFNCLIYSDKVDFIEKITQAYYMDNSKKNEMSQNALHYYNNTLNHKLFASQIINLKPSKLIANAEFVSLQYLDRELNTNYTSQFPNA